MNPEANFDVDLNFPMGIFTDETTGRLKVVSKHEEFEGFDDVYQAYETAYVEHKSMENDIGKKDRWDELLTKRAAKFLAPLIVSNYEDNDELSRILKLPTICIEPSVIYELLCLDDGLELKDIQNADNLDWMQLLNEPRNKSTIVSMTMALMHYKWDYCERFVKFLDDSERSLVIYNCITGMLTDFRNLDHLSTNLIYTVRMMKTFPPLRDLEISYMVRTLLKTDLPEFVKADLTIISAMVLNLGGNLSENLNKT